MGLKPPVIVTSYGFEASCNRVLLWGRSLIVSYGVETSCNRV